MEAEKVRATAGVGDMTYRDSSLCTTTCWYLRGAGVGTRIERPWITGFGVK